MAQSRTMSVVETVTQNVVGFAMAVGLQAWLLPFFGFTPSLGENIQITFAFMLMSALRSYIFRRFFDWLDRGPKYEAPTPESLVLMLSRADAETFVEGMQWDSDACKSLTNNETIVRLGQH